MRGLDTNLLVRYITADEADYYQLTDEFFTRCEARGETLFVSSIVLCELIWSLVGKRYRLDRSAVDDLITRMLESPLFVLQEHDAVKRALLDFRQGKADFADYLLGEINRRAGCVDTVTLDRDLGEHESYTLLASDLYPTGGPPTHLVHEPE